MPQVVLGGTELVADGKALYGVCSLQVETRQSRACTDAPSPTPTRRGSSRLLSAAPDPALLPVRMLNYSTLPACSPSPADSLSALRGLVPGACRIPGLPRATCVHMRSAFHPLYSALTSLPLFLMTRLWFVCFYLHLLVHPILFHISIVF